jgi:hypothetical protein
MQLEGKYSSKLERDEETIFVNSENPAILA